MRKSNSLRDVNAAKKKNKMIKFQDELYAESDSSNSPAARKKSKKKTKVAEIMRIEKLNDMYIKTMEA